MIMGKTFFVGSDFIPLHFTYNKHNEERSHERLPKKVRGIGFVVKAMFRRGV